METTGHCGKQVGSDYEARSGQKENMMRSVTTLVNYCEYIFTDERFTGVQLEIMWVLPGWSSWATPPTSSQWWGATPGPHLWFSRPPSSRTLWWFPGAAAPACSYSSSFPAETITAAKYEATHHELTLLRGTNVLMSLLSISLLQDSWPQWSERHEQIDLHHIFIHWHSYIRWNNPISFMPKNSCSCCIH